MTRKNMKGIVGKKEPTLNSREETGVGMSFTQDHVSDSTEIEKALKTKKKAQGLE